LGLDDTIERRRGDKIAAKGIYRDPVRSSHTHFVKASGLHWLSLDAALYEPAPEHTPETAAQVGIALKDTVGEKVGVDFAKQRSEVRMAGGEIRSSFDILHHLGVGQNARGGLVALHPRRYERNRSRPGKEQCR
jgi:hypothetical protein